MLLSAALGLALAENKRFASRGMQVTHICGNKNCLKVSHLRLQCPSANRLDAAYHAANGGARRGSSRLRWPPIQ